MNLVKNNNFNELNYHQFTYSLCYEFYLILTSIRFCNRYIGANDFKIDRSQLDIHLIVNVFLVIAIAYLSYQ